MDIPYIEEFDGICSFSVVNQITQSHVFGVTFSLFDQLAEPDLVKGVRVATVWPPGQPFSVVQECGLIDPFQKKHLLRMVLRRD